jgi:hypothetical protein
VPLQPGASALFLEPQAQSTLRGWDDAPRYLIRDRDRSAFSLRVCRKNGIAIGSGPRLFCFVWTG